MNKRTHLILKRLFWFFLKYLNSKLLSELSHSYFKKLINVQIKVLESEMSQMITFSQITAASKKRNETEWNQNCLFNKN